jgi:hypothetical protein
MDHRQLFNEALELHPDTQELANEIESLYKKHFPQGWIDASARHSFGEDVISMKFGLVADKKELTGGYWQNDPLKQGFIVRPGKKGWASEQTLGWLAINPAEDSYNAMDSIKTKFRKFNGDSAKTVKAFDKYFKTLKATVREHQANIYNRAKYSDKYFK